MEDTSKLNYLVPNSLEEACEMLENISNSVVYAGGTDLLINIDNLMNSEATLISIKKLDSLKRIHVADSKLVIGSRVTLAEIETSPIIRKLYPVISDTASNMASPQIRNTATIGGNLCNAVPSADTAPPLLVLDAEVKLVSLRDTRIIPLVDFFKGPNITVMKKSEIMESIIIPIHPSKINAVYKKCARRNEVDIATIGIAMAGHIFPDKTVDFIKIAYGAVGPVPFRAFELENLLSGKKIDEDLIDKISEKAGDIIKPITNIRASADYRRTLSRVYTKRLLIKFINNSIII